MIVSSVTDLDIHEAAAEAHVEIVNLRQIGRRFRFTLGLSPDKDERRWQATSRSVFNRGRKVNAVCFHGHYDFMDWLFRFQPEAVIRTAMHGPIVYTADTFDAKAQALGDTNVGPPISPIALRDCCTCEQGF